MVDKTEEFPIQVENKIIEMTPDKNVKSYHMILPCNFYKGYTHMGRLDAIVKDIRGNIVQAVYVTIFGANENDARVQLHKASKELGL